MLFITPHPGVLSMELSAKEREETIAICRSKARHCRELAQRFSHANQRAHMEETAKMWEDLAVSIDPTVIDAGNTA
jgi:hypothetical protein